MSHKSWVSWRVIGRAFAIVVTLAIFVLIPVFQGIAQAAPSAPLAPSPTGATITSDQPDYSPGATVNLTGAGWASGEDVHIHVNDSANNTWSLDSGQNGAPPDPIADSSGGFTYSFALPNTFVASYTAMATGPTSGTATTTFTDAGGNLDQFANVSNSWQHGDINSSNSAYQEGRVVPFRIHIDGLSGGSHTIHLNWDFTAGGHEAYDFLATYNATESPNVCASGGSGASPLCPVGASNTLAFPADPFAPGGQTAAGETVNGAIAFSGVSRQLSMWGGTPVSLTCVPPDGTYTCSGSVAHQAAGAADMLLTFNTGSCTSSCSVLLAWGGHIAQSAYWTLSAGGGPNGAGQISGAPFHMRVQSLDGGGNANDSRSIQPSAIITTLTVNKVLSPSNDPGLFNLLIDGTAHASNVGNGGTTGAVTITAGTHTVSETAGTNTSLSNYSTTISCVNPQGTVVASGSGTSLSVNVISGINVTCTFTNTRLVPSLQITKTADAGTVNAGSTIGYTITVTNSGTGTANNVTVTDTLPTNGGLNWSIASQSGGWSISSGVLSFGPASLAAGASATVHITSPTTAASCGTVNNSASATSSNDGSPSVGPVPITVTCPSLQLTKTADAASVSAGSTIGYTITISNTGAGTANNVMVSDTLPTNSGLTWSIASQSGGWSISAGVLSFGPATLAPGASATVHITSPTTAATCGTVSNSASATSSNDGSPSTPQVSISVNCPSLTLTKTADAGTVSAGDTIGYTITVTNTGAGTANNVTVSDTLPTNSGLTWTIASQSPAGSWSISAGVLSFGPATLAAGASATVHITSPTTSSTCGTVNNSASASSSNDGSPSIGPVSITVNCASLQITKTADTGTVSAGDPIGYTITVTNSGAGIARSVQLNDTLPTNNGLSWTINGGTYGSIPGNSCMIASGVLACGTADLAPGASYTVHISSPTSSATCGTVTNSASAASTNDGSPSTGPVSITVNCASLTLTKTADANTVSAGDQIGYTITVTNTGAGIARSVTVSDSVPSNAGLSWSIDAAGTTGTWTLTSGTLSFGPVDLAAGASYHVHITSPTTSATCGTVTNSASATSTNDGNPGAGPVPISVNCATLTLTKTADAAAVSAGDTIGYTITVTNTGAGTARSVSVTDTLPTNAGLSWSIDAAGTTGTWTLTSGTLSFGPLDLAAGASYHVHITSPTTSATCGTVNNSASASSSNDGSPSIGPVSITVNCASLQITKTADTGTVSAGDPIGYTITVTNSGAGIARSVQLNDTLPTNNGLSWTITGGTYGSISGNSCMIAAGSLACGTADLAPGASYTVHISSPTTSSTCGTVTNTATAASTNDGSPSTSPVSITVNCASLTLTKTADAAAVSAGDQIGYVITVSNTGAGIARSVTVSDSVPTNAGLSWSIDAANSTGTWTLTSGSLSFGPVDLAAGASYHVHITSPTTSATCGTVNNSASATSTNDGNPTAGPVPISVNCATLTLTKTADAGTVSAGDTIGYVITVTNTGAGIARSVTVSDTVPTNAGLSWSIDAAGTTGTWSLTGGTLSFGPQDLAAGASFYVHITSPTTSSTCGTVNNSASAASSNDGSPSVGPVSITVNCASLQITKTADTGAVSAGDPIGYTITVTNSGAGIARSVQVNDTLPANNGLSWSISGGTYGSIAGNSCMIASGVLACGTADLAPGTSYTVHISSPTTSATCGTVTNSASAASTNDGSPSTPQVSITVNCASLTLTKTADTSAVSAGDQIGYVITVTNTGAGIARSVSVSDTVPTNAGLSWSIDAANSTGTWTLTGGTLSFGPQDLAAGVSYHVHIISPTTSATCGTVNNSASATSTNDGSPSAGPVPISVNCATLTLTKTADAGTVSAGDTIGYVITVTNTGAGIARSVTVSDMVPTNSGLTWSIDAAGTTGTWTLTGGTLSFGPQDLGPGVSYHVHITSPTTSATCGTVNNSASASSSNDGNPSVGPVSITVNCASLQITKTADAAAVSAGDTIGYTITVTNSGAGIARSVQLNDTLPTNAGLSWTITGGTYGNISGNTCMIAAGSLACGTADLAPGASYTVHISSPSTSATCGTVTNSATASSTNDGSPSVGPISITVNCAALTLTKTADASAVSAGDQIGYVITVTNTGAGIARSVTVSDTVPTNAGLSWSIDAAGTTGTWTLTGGSLSFGPLDLAAGASYHVHITSPTTSATCGTVNNSALATSTNDGNPSVGPVPISVNCAALQITKTADAASVSAGDTIGYVITVTNTGAGIARSVTVSDTVPTNAGLSWSIDAAGTTGSWTLTSGTLSFGPLDLAAGASYHVHITSPTTSATCGTVNNSASATSSNDGSPSIGPVSITVNCASLQITKTADAGTVSADDTIGYTITVTNSGAGIARSVQLNDTLPTNAGLSWSISGGTYGSIAGNSCMIAAGSLACGTADLGPGASYTVHISSPTTSATCGTVTNSASASSTNDGSPSVGPVPITVNCASLTLTKTADAASVSAGDQIGYTITVTNSGAGIARSVTVKDTLPSNSGLSWTIASQSPAGSWSISAGVLSFGPADLASGASATVHITSPTTSATCGTVNNSASATSTNDGNPSVGPVSITVNCASLQITKTADNGAVSAGDPIGYLITLTNSGAGIARLVTVSDTLPNNAGLNWTIDGGTYGSIPGNTCMIAAGNLVCGTVDLGSGVSYTVHISSPTTSATCGTVTNTASAVSTNDGSPSTGPVSITVNCASLTLTKKADADVVSAGDQIGYTITVTNTGAGIARSVTVSDTVPTNAGLTWSIDAAGTSGTWTLTGGTLSFGPQDLAAGASFHVHITSPTTSATCGTVTNSASASSSNDGSPSVGPISISVNCASLQITKTADAASVSAGDPIGYLITVTNSGAGIARSVQLNDTLPTNGGLSWTITGGTYSGIPGNSCMIAAGSLACGTADLAPGASYTVHISSPTTSATCGTVNNSASASSTNDGSPSVGPVPITVNCASLTLTKMADANTISAGDQIGYVITVTNTGTGTARSVTVSDTVPTNAGLNWAIDAAGTTGSWTLTGGSLSFGPQDLAAGASYHVHITSPTTAATCGTVTNSASATSTNDGNPSVGPIPISVNCAALTLTKTADAAAVSAGDTIGYTITVTNTGAGIARTVSVTDTVPTNGGLNWSIDAAGTTGSWTLTGGTLSFGPLDLAAGASYHVHITSPTTSATCGTVTNSASATSTNDGNPSVGPVPISVNCAVLQLSKTADAGTVSAGDTIGYTITVTNTGVGIARQVSVSDTVPTNSGLSWTIDVAGTTGTWTLTGGTLSFGPQDLAAGASYHVHITSPTTSATCGTVTNSASATSTNDGSPSVGPISITVNCASLQITKMADAAAVSAGDPIGYLITVTNNGAGIARSVQVNDTLPSNSGLNWTINGGTYSSISGNSCLIASGNLVCGTADLGPGASYTVHISSPTTSASCGTVTNTASAASTNDGSPSSGPVPITVNCASLTLTKKADADVVSAGDQIGYTITVTNTGAGIARSVSVSDTLPSNAGLSWSIDAAGTSGTWTLTGGTLSFGPLDLAAGASYHVHLTSPTTAATCGTVNNSVSASSTNDGSPSVGPVPISVNCASLHITKTADAGTVNAGDTIGYVITVTNSGTGVARNVTVSDTLPSSSGLSWTIASQSPAGSWSISAGVLSFGPADLAAGASATVHITSPTTSATCGTVNNSASATSTNDGSSSVGPVPISVNCASLQITKTADAGTVNAGDPIGYLITVTNSGTGIARSVQLNDTLPTNPGLNWTIDSGTYGSIPGNTCLIASGVLACGTADLGPGASYTVHVTSPTTSSTCGTVTNSATASSANDGSPSVGPVPITVNCASLTLTKKADADMVNAGSTIGYVITVTNNGTGIARSVKVSDTVPTNGGLIWSIDAAGTTGTWSLTSGTLSFGPQDLAAGASYHVHITSPTTSSTCGTVNNSASATSTNDGNPTVGPVPISVDCGSLKITKTVNAGGSNFTSGTFGFHVDCGSGGVFDTTINYPTPGSVTLTGIPVGSSCTVTETTLPTPPSGYSWGTPVITGSPATIGNNTTVTVAVTNTLTQTTGSLKITKTLNGGPAGFTGPFSINYSCSLNGTVTKSGTVQVNAGGSATVTGIPTGSVCTVTEPTLPPPPSGYSWGTPQISGSPATIGNNTTVTVAVTNTLTQQTTGSLKITKTLNGGPAGFTGPFSINYSCSLNGTVVKSGTVQVNAGSFVKITGIPAGSVCTVTEPTLPAPPSGYKWGTPQISGSPATIGNNTTVTVEVKNTLIRVPLNTGAKTIGYWQNSNGQSIIKNGASTGGVCNSGTWLRQYAPFQDLSATATCKQVATYVYNVIKAATCGGSTCNAMLKAQMLATALNVYFSDPALGGNKIGAPAPIGGVVVDLTSICQMIDSGGSGSCSGTYENVSSAFGGATSMTVSQMLSYAASQSNVGGTVWYANVKSTQVLAKDAFDGINNQTVFGP